MGSTEEAAPGVTGGANHEAPLQRRPFSLLPHLHRHSDQDRAAPRGPAIPTASARGSQRPTRGHKTPGPFARDLEEPRKRKLRALRGGALLTPAPDTRAHGARSESRGRRLLFLRPDASLLRRTVSTSQQDRGPGKAALLPHDLGCPRHATREGRRPSNTSGEDEPR